MNTPELLDAARKRAGIPSDYALAARLSVTRATVSGWRNGRGVPDVTHAATLADLAGLDWPEVFAALELQRAELAHLPANVAAWRSILQRLGGAAAAVAMVAGLGVAPSPSQAAPDQPRVNPGDRLYIMSSRRRRPGGRAVMAALARALLPSPARTA